MYTLADHEESRRRLSLLQEVLTRRKRMSEAQKRKIAFRGMVVSGAILMILTIVCLILG